VVKYFIDGYTQGITPNPCLVCNQYIRWTFLLSHAMAFGAQYLATGHYARLQRAKNGRIQLMRGCDHSKDQSYILHVLSQEQLSRTIFPLGHLTKQTVRSLAREMNLPVAERPESQDLCFLAGDDYRNFLKRHAMDSIRPGPVLNSQGEIIGTHQGLAFYTIGQRKGLPVNATRPLYVKEKIPSQNAIVLAEKEELGMCEMSVRNLNWVSIDPPEHPINVQVKIRYKAPITPARIEPMKADRVRVIFEQPIRDITPGQAAVFYNEEICLGGGIIDRANT
jgi:tRNA-specific 2-thiouridylase